MKKVLCTFLAVAMLMISSVSDVQAFNANNLLTISKEISKEFSKHENNPEFRDFKFFVVMTAIQLKAWDDALKGKNVEEQREICLSYAAILTVQYISMKKYLELCVIANSSQKESIKEKCQSLFALIDAGLIELKS